MLGFFEEQKVRIDDFLRSFLTAKEEEFSSIGRWDPDIMKRLYEFSASGKMIRGGLVLLAHALYGGTEDNADAVRTAVVMELFQSSFLIHDDIMDRDTTRRGNPSFFYQYKEIGDKLGFKDAYHFGESAGICAGDIAFFLGFEILSGMSLEKKAWSELLNFCSREISYVGLAQMQDIFFGNLAVAPDEDAVMRVYLYKTARYTFSLPLEAGALIAGQNPECRRELGIIGEKLGLIFQIKDDELGLFGIAEKIGKPVGSDIKENKKSLYHYYLHKMTNTEEKKILSAYFGNPNITEENIEEVRKMVRDRNIPEIIGERLKSLVREAEERIRSLKGVNTKYLGVLHELLQYSMGREK